MRRLSVFIQERQEALLNYLNGNTDNHIMTLSIDGIYNINKITRESFQKATVHVGIGTKMAMKRFDDMVIGFSDAMNRAKAELKQQGFEQVEQIYEQIMKKGGIRKESRWDI